MPFFCMPFSGFSEQKEPTTPVPLQILRSQAKMPHCGQPYDVSQ